MLVVAEPEAIEHQGIEPVHHHPKGVGCQRAAKEGRASVDVLDQQTQQHTEDHHGDNLLDVERHASWTVARVHQAQLVAPLDDGGRVVEDALDGVSRHQEHEQREQGARDEGFY